MSCQKCMYVTPAYQLPQGHIVVATFRQRGPNLVKVDSSQGGRLKSKSLNFFVGNQEKISHFQFKVAHFLDFLVKRGSPAPAPGYGPGTLCLNILISFLMSRLSIRKPYAIRLLKILHVYTFPSKIWTQVYAKEDAICMIFAHFSLML